MMQHYHATHTQGQEDPDIVVAILRRVVEMAPGFSLALAQQIERETKAEYGGQRFRIPKDKKHATDQARAVVHQDILGNKTNQQIQRDHGISRATLYRWAKRGPPDPLPD